MARAEVTRGGRYAVGVDLGGTKLATALVSEEGRVLHSLVVPTRAEEGVAAVLERMAEGVERVLSAGGVRREEVAGVGIGAPGSLDRAAGRVIFSPNLGWKDVPLREALSRKLGGAAVVLENDANAAAWGEYRFGAGRGTRNFIYVTISTGIGGGIIVEGRLYRGAGGAAGEVGHMTILAGGPRCSCGSDGCWEALASGTAIARRAREALALGEESALGELQRRGELVTAAQVARAAQRGDRLAQRILAETWFFVGVGLANLANLFDPERIALGGGVAQVGEPLLARARELVRLRALAGPAREVEVTLAALGGEAGVIGAAALAFQEGG
ncbi:MAG: ROK family protein [Bacillota bacterium]|nr:ROK family protein [Bacillota bacterium]